MTEITAKIFPVELHQMVASVMMPHAQLHILGSAGRRNIENWSDVDLFELVAVPSATAAAQQFQQVVRALFGLQACIVTDVKAGQLPDGEACHWTGEELQKGAHTSGLDLAHAVQQAAKVKVDAVRWVPALGRFVELTCLIKFTRDGRTLNAYDHDDMLTSIKKDLAGFLQEGNFAKVAKRMLSIARALGRKADANKLAALVNSPAGALSCIVSDIQLLEQLAEEGAGSRKNMSVELDAMKLRVAKAYGIEGLVRDETSLMQLFDEAAAATSVPHMHALLTKLEEVLMPTLQGEWERRLYKAGLLPLHSTYM